MQEGIEKFVSEDVNATITNIRCNHYFSTWDESIIREWKGIINPLGSAPNLKVNQVVDRDSVK